MMFVMTKKKTHVVSGSEPKNTNYLWYNDPLEVLRHNCMSFAFGTRMSKNTPLGHKQQPGNLSHKKTHVSLSSCKNIVDTVLDDYPDTVYKLEDPYKKCKTGYSKVVLALAKDRDFHFYRQEKDGFWKHKRGLSRVSSVDACGKKIKDPFTSCTDFGQGLDYSKMCTGFCRKVTSKEKKTTTEKNKKSLQKKKKTTTTNTQNKKNTKTPLKKKNTVSTTKNKKKM